MSISKSNTRTFRVVCCPQEISLVENLLFEQGFIFEPDPFFYLARKIIYEPFPLGKSLAAFFGLIYIQDRSSMLPALALQTNIGDIILDMCASPGSKTSLLSQLIGNDGLIIGNEPTKNRLLTLRNNLFKLNCFNTVTCSWPAETMPMQNTSLSKILLDPPCSGWGTIKKNPQVTKIWKDERVTPLIVLQKKLLTEATRLLVPGGKIVYSTCTTNVDENEAQIQFAITHLGLKIVPLELPVGFSIEKPMVPSCEGVIRIINTYDSQGFFIACLQKPGENITTSCNISERKNLSLYPKYPLNTLTSFDIDINKFPQGDLIDFNSTLHFIPHTALTSLPYTLHWQGPVVGKTSMEKVFPSPRIRLLKTITSLTYCLHIENIQQLEKIVQGQSINTAFKGKEIPLFWKELPLGRLKVKNGRAFWSEK